MHDVRGPDGTAWETFVEWEGRQPLSRAFRKLREKREARAYKRAENSRLDLLDGCDAGMDAEAWPVLAVIAVILILILWGPWLFVVLFGVVELGAIVVLVTMTVSAKTLTRRPWRVVAVSSEGRVWAWQQVGFWKARRLAGSIAASLEQGMQPSGVHQERLESHEPISLSPDADLGLPADPRMRYAALVGAFAGICAIVAIVVLRLT